MSKKKKSQDSKTKSKDSKSLLELISDNPELLGELEKLDIDNNETAKVLSVVMRASRSYSGPLPTAEQFKLYEDTCSGAGDRILSCMEKEQGFRHKVDEKAINATASETDKGQLFGFITIIILIISAVLLAINDKDVLAGFFLAPVAIGVVRKFIDGRSNVHITKFKK